MKPYKLLQSTYVIEHQQELIRDLSYSAKSMYRYGIFDTSLKYGSYTQYNIFGATSPSAHMYQLFKEIRDMVRAQEPTGRLWIQSWINHHYENELLEWHNHSATWHGYVSIQPWNTVTEFDNFVIENKVGQIYFGPGGLRHRVVTKDNTPFEDKRITVAFDIMTENDFTGADILPTENFGCIPLL
jgi:hypothetical protein